MVLSFQKQFKGLILDGSKIHTIRSDHPNRWKKNNTIHMATGVRTKQYDCFMLSICTGIQRIFLLHNPLSPDEPCSPTLIVEGKKLNQEEAEFLAINDGFKSIAEFVKWFFPEGYGSLEMKIIHWTDFRY